MRKLKYSCYFNILGWTSGWANCSSCAHSYYS